LSPRDGWRDVGALLEYARICRVERVMRPYLEALLLRVWEAPVGRPTLDIDLLGRMDNEIDAVAAVLREVIQLSVEPDGVVFDVGLPEASRIAEQADGVAPGRAAS